MHRLIFLKTVILFCRREDIHNNRQSVTACFGVRIASETLEKQCHQMRRQYTQHVHTYSRTQLADPSNGLYA